MSDASSAPSSKGSFAATFLAAIGAFGIFGLILIVAYLPNKVDLPEGDGVRSPAERKALLAEHQGREQTKAATYGWVDREAGVVRLPIDRAVELVIQEQKR
jgi:hypothetical protein